MSDFKAKMHPANSISAAAPPQTPLGDLTALPRPLAEFKGHNSKGREGRGEGGEGRGKEKGKEGGEGAGRGKAFPLL